MLIPPGIIGALFASVSPNLKIGSVTFFVISFEARAALTAHQRIASARKFIITFPKNDFVMSRTVFVQSAVVSLNTHFVLNVNSPNFQSMEPFFASYVINCASH
jgi:hypothetical protein